MTASDPHREYLELLRECLAAPPNPTLLESLSIRSTDPSLRAAHSDLATGWSRLTEFFGQHSSQRAPEVVARAHRILLAHPFAPKLDPYASTYQSGSRAATPLVGLREFLRSWNLVVDRERYRDLEDHVVFLLDCMVVLKGLAEKEGGEWEHAYSTLFREHAQPWVPRFLQDLEREDEHLDEGGFYAGLARIGQAIFALENSLYRERR